MQRGRSVAVWARLKVLFLVTLAVTVPAAVGSAQALQSPGAELKPNLQVLPPANLAIRTDSGGFRQLWFATTIADTESGPFEINPKPEDCNGNGDVTDDRTAYQRLFTDANGDGVFERGIDTVYRDVKVGCTYFHPAHNHWHFDNYARYDLIAYNRDGSLGRVVGSSQKVSFCIADELQLAPEVAGSPANGYYSQLATGCSQDSPQGTSSGWADEYGTDRDGQYISLAGLSDGTYCLSMTANPAGAVQETSTTDNTTRTKVTISGTRVTYTPYQPCTGAEANPPDTSITSGPQSSSTGSAATFAFASTSGGYRFQCRLDGGAWTACSAPKTVTGLANGQHTFYVRALDVFSRTDATPAARTWTVAASGPPANDMFARAASFDRASGSVTVDTTYATRETNEPTIVWNNGGHSVWYSWTPTATGGATIDTTGSSFDTTLAVYTGNSLATLQTVVQDDDGAGGRLSRVNFQAVGGTTYRIQADGYNGTSGGVWFGVLKLNWSGPGAGAPPPPPANDAFTAAQPLSGPSGTVTGDTNNATVETGEPQIVGNPGGHSVWFSWSAATTGPASFDSLGSSYDTTLAVYTGSTLGALTKIAEDDDSAGNRLSKVSFTAAAGTTYRIQLDGVRGSSGPAWFGAYKLNWSAVGAPPPSGGPSNDHFANAQSLNGPSGSVSGDTTSATREIGEPQIVNNSGGHSVWFKWSPTAAGTTTIDLTGSVFDTTLAVYTGTTLTGLTKVADDDDSAGGRLSRIAFTATAGTVYRIQVDGYNGTSGPAWFGAYKLSWTGADAPPPAGGPPNDHFANAQALSGASGSVSGDTSSATRESGEPQIVGNSGGHSVWFAWTANAAGSTTLDTIGSVFDTTLAVYTGSSLNALTRVAEDDDSAGNRQSRVTFTATAGTTYRIQVDGFNGTSGGAWYGAVTLTWNRPAAAPPPPPPPPPPSTPPSGGPANDNFANAQALSGLTGTASGDTTNATVEQGEPQIVGNSGGHSLWYAITPSTSYTVVVDTIGSAFDTTLAVYTGSSLGALAKIGDDDDSGGSRTSRISFAATAGTTYYIQVDGYNGTSGPAWYGASTLNWS